jgi:hypothetical protein
MLLLLRYLGLFVLSIILILLTVVPTDSEQSTMIDLWVRALYVPIYLCLSVFLMTGFRPVTLRKKLKQTPNRLDDLHLWLAPMMVLLAFLWADFVLAGMLAVAGFADTHPFYYLGLLLGGSALAVWMATRVRQAFFTGA